jgi:hypothetical protein
MSSFRLLIAGDIGFKRCEYDTDGSSDDIGCTVVVITLG